jgi:hypothetical protein
MFLRSVLEREFIDHHELNTMISRRLVTSSHPTKSPSNLRLNDYSILDEYTIYMHHSATNKPPDRIRLLRMQFTRDKNEYRSVRKQRSREQYATYRMKYLGP